MKIDAIMRTLDGKDSKDIPLYQIVARQTWDEGLEPKHYKVKNIKYV